MNTVMKRENQKNCGTEEMMFADDLVLIRVDQGSLQEMVSNIDQQWEQTIV